MLTIGNRRIGPAEKTLIVAELGGNAARSFDTAQALMRAAADAGADVCKTQVFTPDSMTLRIDQPSHRLTWNGRDRTLWDLYAETAMPLAWHEPLMALAGSLGLMYFGSVFDDAGIALGERLGFPAYKLASFEITSLPLIRAIARTGKPILLSTGMATIYELWDAWDALNATWPSERKYAEDTPPWVWLRCTTAYPAPLGAANLRSLADTKLTHLGMVGLSDHSRNNSLVSAAVALGARVVERHLTLRRSDGGPDAPFSDEPHEFAAMVRAIRDTEAALGTVHYGPTESEMGMLRYRRSIWVVADIPAGDTLTPGNIAVLRPEGGLPPCEWDGVLGRKATRWLERGTALREEHLEG